MWLSMFSMLLCVSIFFLEVQLSLITDSALFSLLRVPIFTISLFKIGVYGFTPLFFDLLACYFYIILGRAFRKGTLLYP